MDHKSCARARSAMGQASECSLAVLIPRPELQDSAARSEGEFERVGTGSLMG